MDKYYSGVEAGERSRPFSLTVLCLTQRIAKALEKSASENDEATDRRLASLTKVSVSNSST
jgi:hypothetical protein